MNNIINLKRNWYPVLISSNLKQNSLIKFQLFGIPFVLFRDKFHNPVCLEDRCPHRGTPLSLGKVSNGQLECKYHGWCFGTAGQCQKIPTLSSDKPIPKKAHAKNYPCLDKHGAIWVVPNNMASDETPLFHDHLFDVRNETESKYILSSWDVNVAYDLFIENLLDLSHLPFIHHNTLSRRSRAQPITFDLLPDKYALISGEINYHTYKNDYFRQIYKFVEPCIIQYDFISKKNNKSTISQFYCVPISKELTRVFCYRYPSTDLSYTIQNSWLMRLLGKPIEKLIAKQDLNVLQGQYRNKALGANLLNQPVQADLLVSQFRQWLNKQNIDSYWFKEYSI